MKNLNLIGSILHATKKIISNADSDWRGIREGHIVKFQTDNLTYQAVKTEPFFYIRDFEVIDDHTLAIHDNTSVFLSKGDDITISFKEYELLTVFQVVNGGKGYKIDDVLFLEGGTPSTNISDGIIEKAYLRVADVLPGGIITKATIDKKGKYIEVPAKECKVSGGNGTGALFKVDYKLLDARALIERDIVSIEITDKTIIKLQYPVPAAVKEGKISVQKYSLLLNSEYNGTDKNGETFLVFGDFTENYNWPLTIPNSFSMHSIINQVFVAQDKKIKELEERLKKLEK